MPTETTITEDREQSALLNVQAVAGMLTCSVRHVYRLSDAGRMPPPVKLGGLVRWSRRAVEEWLMNGCPSVRTTSR
jgi:excisionase family DNA binding protein